MLVLANVLPSLIMLSSGRFKNKTGQVLLLANLGFTINLYGIFVVAPVLLHCMNIGFQSHTGWLHEFSKHKEKAAKALWLISFRACQHRLSTLCGTAKILAL